MTFSMFDSLHLKVAIVVLQYIKVEVSQCPTSVEMSLFHLLSAMRFSNSFVIFLIFSLVADRVSGNSHQAGKSCSL